MTEIMSRTIKNLLTLENGEKYNNNVDEIFDYIETHDLIKYRHGHSKQVYYNRLLWKQTGARTNDIYNYKSYTNYMTWTFTKKIFEKINISALEKMKRIADTQIKLYPHVVNEKLFMKTTDVELKKVYYYMIIPWCIYTNESTIMHLYLTLARMDKKILTPINELMNDILNFDDILKFSYNLWQQMDSPSIWLLSGQQFFPKYNTPTYMFRCIYSTYNTESFISKKFDSWSSSYCISLTCTDQYKYVNLNAVMFIKKYSNLFFPVAFANKYDEEREYVTPPNTFYKIINQIDEKNINMYIDIDHEKKVIYNNVDGYASNGLMGGCEMDLIDTVFRNYKNITFFLIE